MYTIIGQTFFIKYCVLLMAAGHSICSLQILNHSGSPPFLFLQLNFRQIAFCFFFKFALVFIVLFILYADRTWSTGWQKPPSKPPLHFSFKSPAMIDVCLNLKTKLITQKNNFACKTVMRIMIKFYTKSRIFLTKLTICLHQTIN